MVPQLLGLTNFKTSGLYWKLTRRDNEEQKKKIITARLLLWSLLSHLSVSHFTEKTRRDIVSTPSHTWLWSFLEKLLFSPIHDSIIFIRKCYDSAVFGIVLNADNFPQRSKHRRVGWVYKILNYYSTWNCRRKLIPVYSDVKLPMCDDN